MYDPESRNGLGYILHRLRADIDKRHRQFVFYLLEGAAGDAYTSRLGKSLQAGSDIHPVSEEIISLDHHIADIDADPEKHLLVIAELSIANCELFLDGHRAPDRFHGTFELGKHGIAGGVENPAVMLDHKGIDDVAIVAKSRKRRFLIARHKPAVSSDVCRQNGRQSAPGMALAHSSFPFAATASAAFYVTSMIMSSRPGIDLPANGTLIQLRWDRRKTMKIGTVSAMTNLPAKTIRYYEDIALVTPARRGNGYREYSDKDAHRLRFLQRARSLGFTIQECRTLVSLYDDTSRASADVKAIALGKIAEVDRKIEELQSLRLTLSTLADHCHGDDRPDCPIIDDLAGGSDL